MDYPENDDNYEETSVKTVRKETGGWAIERADGWSFYVSEEHGVEPKVGDVTRFYPRGHGSVRGLFLDGKKVFYRTQDEQIVYQDEQTYGKDVHEVMRRWDSGRGVWSVSMGGFGPGYEQALQLTAFEFLRAMISLNLDADKWEETWEQDKKAISAIVEPIVQPLGLSGAQWGAAMNLASILYKQGPIKAMTMPEIQDRKIQVSKHFPQLAKA